MSPHLASLRYTNAYAALGEPFSTPVAPTPFTAPPRVLHFNPAAAALLDLDPAVAADPQLPTVFSGAQALPGMAPRAALYAGHQFGVYVPQLGDGRALLLGEVRNEAGERWEIQLKGSGPTPYSRGGDGRAVLRSSIREYLCSEAMHALGIPTTRALCLIGADEPVVRERVETGAMVTRLAPTHVRFGSFEVFYYREQHDHTRTLADFVLAHHYPEIEPGDPARYQRLFETVVGRTARLIAQWQAVGFAHGVMNTDNMSILGLTLDYGPFGFMEVYDPGYICNHSDHHGRYAFERQPQIALFNLSCLAQAMLPLMEFDAAKAALDAFDPQYQAHYGALMARKLGFDSEHGADPAVTALRETLLQLMRASRADYTRVFRALAGVACEGPVPPALRDQFIDREALDRWVADWRARLRAAARNDAARGVAMRAANPRYVLRNYLAQRAIEQAERGDYREIDNLMRVLARPYDEQPEAAHYDAPAPDWAQNLQVSCSS
ncbi:YdiU family protein [Ectothiorhodospiraceae bacterium 2226]|nr:YdiU family protein [Ectothiorhodospiraceae bacterium 2226]